MVDKTASNNKNNDLGRCLVTGGSGFLGRNLVKALLDKGCEVRVFDLAPSTIEHDSLSFVQGDITDTAQVAAACEGIDTVFHTAAIIALGGGAAVTRDYRDRSFRINVEGTRNIIEACQQQQVKRLIYTSSNNVCFNGTPAFSMDSRTPYASRVYDLYTETKIVAEKLVRAANGEKGVATCAIRPAGIYGAESNVMFDRLCEELAGGKLVAAIGNPNAVHDNVFIDNLVHAQVLAASKLTLESPVAGNAYFIGDGEPENYFEFFRPIIEGLGFRFPKLWIPMGMLMPLVTVWQWLHFKGYAPAPMMSPKELDKVAVTHFATNDDARRDFGYEPVCTVAEALEASLPYCRAQVDKALASA